MDKSDCQDNLDDLAREYTKLRKTAEFMAWALKEAENAVHGALPHQVVADALASWKKFNEEYPV